MRSEGNIQARDSWLIVESQVLLRLAYLHIARAMKEGLRRWQRNIEIRDSNSNLTWLRLKSKISCIDSLATPILKESQILSSFLMEVHSMPEKPLNLVTHQKLQKAQNVGIFKCEIFTNSKGS